MNYNIIVYIIIYECHYNFTVITIFINININIIIITITIYCRRRFEVQVQGKFIRMPEGEVYIGAEGSSKMQLGLITRSISNAACNLASTMANNLHYSFGDDTSNPLYQLPHMVSPIFPTFDKVIATPPNQTPPKIGEPFIEDPEYRKIRCQWSQIADAKIDLDTTYSFSVNTSNIDLCTWCIMNIPLVRPMDLRNFFGDSSIALGKELININAFKLLLYYCIYIYSILLLLDIFYVILWV